MTSDDSRPPDSSDGGVGAVNRRAVISLLLGLGALAFFFVFELGTFVLGLPAITLGIHARREIAGSAGTESGESLASSGVILGAGTIALAIASFLLDVLQGR